MISASAVELAQSLTGDFSHLCVASVPDEDKVGRGSHDAQRCGREDCAKGRRPPSFGLGLLFTRLFRLSQIMEIIQTGGLVRIKYETTEDIKAIRLFTGIYGVGEHFRLFYRCVPRLSRALLARRRHHGTNLVQQRLQNLGRCRRAQGRGQVIIRARDRLEVLRR